MLHPLWNENMLEQTTYQALKDTLKLVESLEHLHKGTQYPLVMIKANLVDAIKRFELWQDWKTEGAQNGKL